MMIKFKKRTKGFGILEVLLSGVIIIIVLGALVVLARNALNNAKFVQERAQAVNLAQEGMEIVRQIRDSNYIDGRSNTTWRTLSNSGLTVSIAYNTNYRILFNSGLPMNFYLATGSSPINLDGNNFYRVINFTNIAGANQILTIPDDVSMSGGNGTVVTATVRWPTVTGPHSVEIRELLANSRFQF